MSGVGVLFSWTEHLRVQQYAQSAFAAAVFLQQYFRGRIPGSGSEGEMTRCVHERS